MQRSTGARFAAPTAGRLGLPAVAGALALAALGCGFPVHTNPPAPDLAAAKPDFAGPHDAAVAVLDLAVPVDDAAAPPDDLAKGRADLAKVHDLAKPDLRPAPRDLAGADLSTPDLRMPRADLASSDLAVGCTPKINEVQTAGVTADDEFVELFNPCPNAIDLTGYKLAYRSSMGVADVTLFTFVMQTIPAAGYLVAGQTNYAGMADVHYASSISATGGGLGLRHPNGEVVDAVGWGNAVNLFVETKAAAAPTASKSIERLPDGTDSDDNSKDLMVGNAPTPRAPNR